MKKKRNKLDKYIDQLILFICVKKPNPLYT